MAIGGAYYAYRRYLAHRPFEWAGTVEARAVTVASRTGGRVKQVLVREGDRVQPNQPLIILEPGDLEAQRAIAQAQLEQMKAALDKLEKGARPEEIAQAKARAAGANAALAETRHGSRGEEIAAAEAQVAQVQALVDKAQLDSDRAHRLLASEAIPKAEADAADTALRTAKAQRDAQQKRLDQLRAGARAEEKAQAAARAQEAQAAANLVIAGPRVEDMRAAAAQVSAAQGRLDQLAILIDELTIRAPAAARIESLDLRPGDLLAPNAPAATVLEDDQLYIRLYVPETQIGRIKVGQEVPITVDSFGDRTFKGKVEHINARGEYSPRNLQTADERADQVFAVRITLLEGKDDLRAGMAATVRVPK
ncbi:MAG TPA: HlyD family efflux transporter periplasmic adaptor subunit [Kofleriaceae bacterium]